MTVDPAAVKTWKRRWDAAAFDAPAQHAPDQYWVAWLRVRPLLATPVTGLQLALATQRPTRPTRQPLPPFEGDDERTAKAVAAQIGVTVTGSGWSGTASTMRPRWPPPTLASRWGSGADVALQTAGVTLMRGDPLR